VLYGKVYDVTYFLSSHPGGAAAILRFAGQDATEEFDPIHPPGTLEENHKLIQCVGQIDDSTPPTPPKAKDKDSGATFKMEESVSDAFVPENLEECLNLDDIERLATRKVSKRAWSYYYSAGDDLISKAYNNTVYQKILLRPRIFVDCTRCSLEASVLQGDVQLKLPVYISPAAQARLCHPSGEGGIAKACAKFGTLQIISNNASLTPEQIVAASPDTTFGFQLYIQKDVSKSEAMLARIRKLPQVKFICLTLDQPVAGKREHDERHTILEARRRPRRQSTADDSISSAGGLGKTLFAGLALDLTWSKTLSWLRKHSGNLPIILKGIQTHEDAYIASTFAPEVRGIILSNHGGRALDTAPPAIHTLLEIHKYCPEILRKIEIWVDGGIRRGTDVVKALCLGAKAVGVGRAALWALGAGGTDGVEKMLEILKSEAKTCMRLLGAERLDQLDLRFVSIM
jgi:L-lactate dehydrogenase (cytochrome)